MSDEILAVGPPPLTAVAADCAIALIDFMAAVVRGVDLIDVTPAVRQAWRAELAMHYPILPLPHRLWYANAPGTLATIQAQPQPPQPQADADPTAMMARKAESTRSFIKFSNDSAFNTINLMRAFNQQPPLRRY